MITRTMSVPIDSTAYRRWRGWLVAGFLIWFVSHGLLVTGPRAGWWPRSHSYFLLEPLLPLVSLLVFLAASRREEFEPRLRLAMLLLAAERLLPLAVMLLPARFNFGIHFTHNWIVWFGWQGRHAIALVSLVLFVSALFAIPVRESREGDVLREWLDVAMIVGGAAVVLYVAITQSGHWARERPGVLLSFPPTLVLVLKYVVGFIALNRALNRTLSQPVRHATMLLLAFLILQAIASACLQLTSAARNRAVWFSIAFFASEVAPICLFLAGISFFAARSGSDRQRSVLPWTSGVYPIAPLAVLALGAGVVAGLMISATEPDLADPVLAMLALFGIFVIRVNHAARGRDRQIQLSFDRERSVHAERVKSIQRLAGGIAHHFNNLMTVVIATADIEQVEVAPGSSVHEGLTAIRTAGTHAAELTARLRTYAGDTPVGRDSVCLGELVTELKPSIDATVGERASVQYEIAPAVASICGERSLLASSVLHLVKNATAAMPDGGDLTIRLEQRPVHHEELADAVLPAPAGTYAVLSVQDQGVGFPTGSIRRNFDPFYSNESFAVAQGLGLSVVHGAIASHHGGIAVDSTTGKGTTVRLYLPVASPYCEMSSGRVNDNS